MSTVSMWLPWNCAVHPVILVPSIMPSIKHIYDKCLQNELMKSKKLYLIYLLILNSYHTDSKVLVEINVSF